MRCRENPGEAILYTIKNKDCVRGAGVRRLLLEILFRLLAQGKAAAGELDLSACGRGRCCGGLVFFRFASFAITSYLAFSHFVLLGGDGSWRVKSCSADRHTKREMTDLQNLPLPPKHQSCGSGVSLCLLNEADIAAPKLFSG
jgi:hypothetical protein